MRSRILLSLLGCYLALSALGCSSKPSTGNNADASNANATNADSGSADAQGTAANGGKDKDKDSKEGKDKDKEAARLERTVVPAGTSITVSLGSALGSKLSQPGQTFTGSVARNVLVHKAVAIPQGATVSGTVTDAKALGKFAGGATLQVRLDSITLNGADLPVQTAVRTFSQKGKGKRTAVIAGGGAALGGLIGGLAGGGKGAAIGLAAGGGAGTGGAALTGNKEIVLPAESAVSFTLSQHLEVRQ
jgi:hypothetical protein